jgi:type II secretory pathway pseudopilin PulG
MDEEKRPVQSPQASARTNARLGAYEGIVMRRQLGYTVVEILVVIAVLAIVLGLLLPMSYRHRQTATLNESMGNMRQLGAFSAQYSSDYDDFFFHLSWRANVTQETQWIDLRSAPTDLQAASNQAVDIIRRLSQLTSAQAPSQTFWFPMTLYSTLVLWDYTKFDSPFRLNVSPGDWRRLCWTNSFSRFISNACGVNQPNPDSSSYRWFFSSSYEVGVAFYSADSGPNAILQSNQHNTYTVPGTLQPRRTSEVLFPAQKAHMWDSNQRHFGQREFYFASSAARVPVLTVDGSVRVRSGEETNGGWIPNNPQDTINRTLMTYGPASYEPDSSFGQISGLWGRQRYTAQGLRGRDFDGDEIR